MAKNRADYVRVIMATPTNRAGAQEPAPGRLDLELEIRINPSLFFLVM
jgi:hypothetical protein